MIRYVPVFAASFFLSLHYAVTLFVNSSFLGNFFPQNTVSAIFIIGAVINIYFFLRTPVFISKFGAKALLLATTLIAGAASAGMAFTNDGLYALTYFLIYSGSMPLVWYCLDIFLESLSLDSNTGEVRGLFLTVGNTAVALGPLAVAAFALRENLSQVYLISFVLIIPVFLISLWFKPVFKAHKERAVHLKKWWHSPALRKSTIARFTLHTFYAVMVIYSPLYLHDVIGFDWKEIGVMFTIMLLPFILFEWPVGEIADRKLGEKEFMISGFFVSGLALVIMPFLGASFVLWTAILFASRIGASFIEITTESYFFKHVSAEDDGLISIFRLSNPAGTVTGALIGGLTVALLPFYSVFFVLAGFLSLGVFSASQLRDTR